VIIGVTLEAFLCRDATQLFAVSLQNPEFCASDSPPFPLFGSLFCRKFKAEVKACRKFKGCKQRHDWAHLVII
jgi:hypothetical protein